MTIATTTTKSGPYNGNDALTAFAYDFLILDEDHLEVTLTDSAGVETIQTITTHYTVDNVGNPVGGDVTMVTAPATGETLTIRRSMPYLQDIIDLVSQAGFNSETIEDAFDYVVMHLQQQKEEIERAILIEVSDDSQTSDELRDSLLAAEVNAVAAASAAATSETNAATSETNAAASAAAAAADLVLTNADVVLTNADVVLTNADVVLTNADVALTNADAAATAADVITTNADAAATAADAIATAADAISTAADAALCASLYDQFDDRYLGSKASDPTLDNDGDALLTGALYWNTSSGDLRVYDGAAWQNYSPNTISGIVDTSDATAIWIDANEQVGIGIAVPTRKLHVFDTGTTIPARVEGNSTACFIDFKDTNTTADNKVRFGCSTDDAVIYAGGAEAMRIDSSGNVGIGVTPEAWNTIDATLQIGDRTSLAGWVGNSYLTNNAYYSTGWKHIDTALATQIAFGGTGTITFNQASSGTADTGITWTAAMKIDASGNVGIGTSSPVRDLVVSNTAANTFLQVTNSTVGETTADGLQLIMATSGEATIKNYENAAMLFATNNTERMRINNSGKVGIGTSSPAYAGDIRSTASPTMRISRNGTTGQICALLFEEGNATLGSGDTARIASADGYISFNTGGTSGDAAGGSEAMRIDASGNALIGKTATGIGTAGSEVYAAGGASFTRASASPLAVNRQTSDGQLIQFYQDGTLEGDITVSGTTVAYNGGHLARNTQLSDDSRPVIKRGTVMSSTGEMCDFIRLQNKVTKAHTPIVREGLTSEQRVKLNSSTRVEGIKGTILEEDSESYIVRKDNEQLTRSKVSDIAGDTAVSGVFDMYSDLGELTVAENGDFVIRVTGPIMVGELLESNGDGTARAQSDNLVKSSTIGKALVSVAQAVGQESTIACLLMLA